MTATERPGRRLACIALLLAALPLTACAAGYQAETSRERTALTSVSGAMGDLSLRNVFWYGPASKGQSLPLYLSIFNGGTSGDRLVRVSSSAASAGAVPSNNAVPAGGQLDYNQGSSGSNASDVPTLTLNKDVLVGQTVNVTLTFAEAGALTLTVPVDGPVSTPSVPAAS